MGVCTVNVPIEQYCFTRFSFNSNNYVSLSDANAFHALIGHWHPFANFAVQNDHVPTETNFANILYTTLYEHCTDDKNERCLALIERFILVEY